MVPTPLGSRRTPNYKDTGTVQSIQGSHAPHLSNHNLLVSCLCSCVAKVLKTAVVIDVFQLLLTVP